MEPLPDTTTGAWFSLRVIACLQYSFCSQNAIQLLFAFLAFAFLSAAGWRMGLHPWRTRDMASGKYIGGAARSRAVHGFLLILLLVTCLLLVTLAPPRLRAFSALFFACDLG